MTETPETRRRDLRERLIDAAEARIAAGGAGALRARDIAAEAGCALGSIYSVCGGLPELVRHVNRRTLGRLDAALAAARADDPRITLTALARAYAGFAAANPRLWAALLDPPAKDGDGDRDTLEAEQAALLAHIATPLARLMPDLAPEEAELRARTWFAAVHGVVTLSLQGWHLGLPRDRLEGELDRLVAALVAGSASGA